MRVCIYILVASCVYECMCVFLAIHPQTKQHIHKYTCIALYIAMCMYSCMSWFVALCVYVYPCTK